MIIQQTTIKNPLGKSGLVAKSLCDLVINAAMGCLHGCSFCYVPATPIIRMNLSALGESGVEDAMAGWGSYLFYRENTVEALREALGRKRAWPQTLSGRGVVMMSSTTDPFQNKRMGLISEGCMELLLEANRRVRILTRSPSWMRLPKAVELMQNPNLILGMSIPTLDDHLSRQIEPKAPRPSDRLKAMKFAHSQGIRTYVAIAPTVPMMDKEGFKRLLGELMLFNPEVMFWEPINARGSNGDRMTQAGIDWAASVSDRKTWAENFERQWGELKTAAEDLGILERIHPWFDSALVKEGRLVEEVHYWKSRPTVEKWPNLVLSER